MLTKNGLIGLGLLAALPMASSYAADTASATAEFTLTNDVGITMTAGPAKTMPASVVKAGTTVATFTVRNTSGSNLKYHLWANKSSGSGNQWFLDDSNLDHYTAGLIFDLKANSSFPTTMTTIAGHKGYTRNTEMLPNSSDTLEIVMATPLTSLTNPILFKTHRITLNATVITS
ncbi:hypothetical protein I6G97_00465 [Edwardsiella hoshinae]|uniref:Uncharacterized protein n=1 Tax=Edwardsiella hoshinae TaxID=93378 RepID=A0A376D7T8_9GAMM|nr:hypothetical protein [Edwardsiella hoshinae]QPR28176.1 hypothetical protein I6G97_00465 [Edwardsiella hoshinae]STC84542.1 Uncharacterised protein [Edwardsiella hoshinae]